MKCQTTGNQLEIIMQLIFLKKTKTATLNILTEKKHFADIPLYGYRLTHSGATAKYHPRLLETYLQEYQSLIYYASNNSVLD